MIGNFFPVEQNPSILANHLILPQYSSFKFVSFYQFIFLGEQKTSLLSARSLLLKQTNEEIEMQKVNEGCYLNVRALVIHAFKENDNRKMPGVLSECSKKFSKWRLEFGIKDHQTLTKVRELDIMTKKLYSKNLRKNNYDK